MGSCESEGEGRQLRAHTGTMWLCPFSTVPASPHEEGPGALKGPGSRGPRVRGLVKFAEAEVLICVSPALPEQELTEANRGAPGALVQCPPENGGRTTCV